MCVCVCVVLMTDTNDYAKTNSCMDGNTNDRIRPNNSFIIIIIIIIISIILVICGICHGESGTVGKDWIT